MPLNYLVSNLFGYEHESMQEGIRINQITAGHAKEFHKKHEAKRIAPMTIRNPSQRLSDFRCAYTLMMRLISRRQIKIYLPS